MHLSQDHIKDDTNPMFTQLYKHRRAILYPAAETPRGVVILAPGFPKYPGPSKFTVFLQEKNYDVLVPQYSGTFDSEGDFSIKNSVSDIALWYDFIERGILQLGPKETKRVDYSEIILFSTSYGGLVSGLALRQYGLPKVRKCIFITPLWDMGAHKNNPQQLKVADETAEIMLFAYPLSYRFADKEEFFSQIRGEKELPLMHQKSKNDKKKVLIITSTEDTVTPREMGAALGIAHGDSSQIHTINGGHSSRVEWDEFSNIVKNFL